MSEDRKAPEFPPTPFYSPRNVPFWMGLVFLACFVGMIAWIP